MLFPDAAARAESFLYLIILQASVFAQSAHVMQKLFVSYNLTILQASVFAQSAHVRPKVVLYFLTILQASVFSQLAPVAAKVSAQDSLTLAICLRLAKTRQRLRGSMGVTLYIYIYMIWGESLRKNLN